MFWRRTQRSGAACRVRRSGRQAAAFQYVLDRLQALNLIAWQRYPSEIEVTVASDAASLLAHGV